MRERIGGKTGTQFVGRGADQGTEEKQMNRKTYILPNGKEFTPWEDRTEYKRVLHVSQRNGTENGDGSPERPFLTITQSLEFAEPGTMVLIHGGVYRETVRPVISGRSETEMVMFCGAVGEEVEITGAEFYTGGYRTSEGWTRREAANPDNSFVQPDARVYMGKLDRNMFIGVNPFSMANGPLVPWYNSDLGWLYVVKRPEERKNTTMRRGMLFCDGVRVEQVLNYFELGQKDNRFFVEDDGLTFHIRFPGDSAPEGHSLEFTAREQCFCPEERYFSYIHLKNLRFTKGGNGFPPPQRGILSTNCGNHWIIEVCHITDANGVGADISFQCPNRYSSKDRGHQIVRNCHFSRCGIVGLTGTPATSDTHYFDNQQEGFLIENNRFIDNCWWDYEDLMENAGVKIHRLKDSVIANNYVIGTAFGSGIWTDAFNTNLLIEGNVVLHTGTQWGAIFIEASKDDLLMRHNIVVDVKKIKTPHGGDGLYSHTSEDVRTVRNISLGCQGSGIGHHSREPLSQIQDIQRIDGGSGQTGNGFDTLENVVADCTHLVTLGSERCKVDGNIYGSHRLQAPLRLERPQVFMDLAHWRKNFDFDRNGRSESIAYSLTDEDTKLVLTIGRNTYSINLLADVGPQIDRIFD